MTNKDFFIPNGIEYFMPEDAKRFDKLKSQTLKIFNKYNYKYVIPPISDSLGNLFNLNSTDLKESTMTFQDSNSGEKFGIRADITPQIAKIDLHLSKKNKSINKLAYLGDIIRISSNNFDRVNPFQVGAEYFGNLKPDTDVELIKMLLEILSLSKDKNILIELGDLSVINQLLEKLSLNSEDRSILITLINLKSVSEIIDFFSMKKMNKNICSLICDLVTLNGNISVISKIKGLLSKSNFRLNHNLKNLEFISSKIIKLPNVFDVQIDLCNLNTLNYQKDIIYSAYIQNIRKEIAKGGRYVAYNTDKPRNASGFSLDLKDIYSVLSRSKDV